MNLPNKLTLLRMILVPIFLFFLLVDTISYNYLIALIIFAIASITDALDGNIARKYNLVTNFGKFMDPFADKLLVLSAFIAFIDLKLASSIVVIIIVARELLVTSLRTVAADNGIVIAASNLGKLKTIIQMVSIIVILLILSISQFVTLNFDIVNISNILMWVCAAITLLSGVDYLVKNKSCINTYK